MTTDTDTHEAHPTDQRSTAALSDVELGALQQQLAEFDAQSSSNPAHRPNEGDDTRELDVREHLAKLEAEVRDKREREDEGPETPEGALEEDVSPGEEIKTQQLDEAKLQEIMEKAKDAKRQQVRQKLAKIGADLPEHDRGEQMSTARISKAELRKACAASEPLRPMDAPIEKVEPLDTSQIRRIERHGTPRAVLLGEDEPELAERSHSELVVPTQIDPTEVSSELELPKIGPKGISGSGFTHTQRFEKEDRRLKKHRNQAREAQEHEAREFSARDSEREDAKDATRGTREREVAQVRRAESRVPQAEIDTHKVASRSQTQKERNGQPILIGVMVMILLALVINIAIQLLE